MMHKKAMFVLAAVASLATACGEGGIERTAAAPDATSAPAQAAAPTATVAFAEAARQEPGEVAKIRCAVDRINGQAAGGQVVGVAAGEALRFRGWISDTAKRAPEAFTIVLSGPATYTATGATGQRRPDVARVHRSEGLATAGYDIVASTGAVAAGEYAVELRLDAPEAGACQTRARVAIRG